MPLQKLTELQNWTEETLSLKLADLRQEYLDARRNHMTQGLPNPTQLRYMRRDIARILTEQGRRSQN
jgi:ribosomal protein L29